MVPAPAANGKHWSTAAEGGLPLFGAGDITELDDPFLAATATAGEILKSCFAVFASFLLLLQLTVRSCVLVRLSVVSSSRRRLLLDVEQNVGWVFCFVCSDMFCLLMPGPCKRCRGMGRGIPSETARCVEERNSP